MSEAAIQHEVIRRWQEGTPIRRIAAELRISRYRVQRIILAHQTRRAEGMTHPDLPVPPQSRGSILDGHVPFVQELLTRWPAITAMRVHEELRQRGFAGGYTIVKDLVRRLRPAPRRQPVLRFETGPGVQAQMDYAVYKIDFTEEGRRRVNLFSYVLGYSRRQYLRFVESQDFETTIREHVRAFTHLGGVAATCLYDNMKVVVARYEGDEPIYNTRFLAFATHYGYSVPWRYLGQVLPLRITEEELIVYGRDLEVLARHRLGDQQQRHLREILQDRPVPPRPTADYEQLGPQEPPDDEPPPNPCEQPKL